MTIDAAEKVVLITGASGDIGLAIVKKFISNNNIIICQYNNSKDKLEELQQQHPTQIYLLKAEIVFLN